MYQWEAPAKWGMLRPASTLNVIPFAIGSKYLLLKALQCHVGVYTKRGSVSDWLYRYFTLYKLFYLTLPELGGYCKLFSYLVPIFPQGILENSKLKFG